MSSSQSDTTFVFVGSYNDPEVQTDGKTRGIATYRIDPASGALSLTTSFADITNPSYLCLHPSQAWLYAVNEREDGGVSAFAIDAQSGALSPINQRPSHGSYPAHISIDHSGRWILTANYVTGRISVYPIQDDGSLGDASAVVQHEGQSVHPERQESPHAHFITVDPNNRFVLVADLGLDAVMVYRFDQEAGTLEPNEPPSLGMRSGAGPRHVVFHPSGRYVYVINELDSTIVACEYDATNGVLTPIQVESTLPADFSGENTTAAIRIAPLGQFLYGSNRGHNSLAIFAIDPATGRLSAVGHASTQGKTPRDFNIDATGTFLLAANQDSNSLVSFRIDQSSGELTPTGNVSEVITPVCVLFGS